MLHNLHLPTEHGLDPLDETTFLVRAIGPNQLESRQAAFEWLQEVFAALVILDAGLMDEYVQDHPRSVDEQVPLAPFHPLAAVIAASPPISLVFTD